MGASTPKEFDSRMKVVCNFYSEFSQETIKNEPMFFNCDMMFAYQNSGPITKAFLDAAPDDWGMAVFDSRVHMLMPGWYPAIPGWHHDDVPRPEIPIGQHFITAGQPDYDNPRYLSQHLCGLVNAEICPTAFAVGKCIMPAIQEGELIYRQWHQEVESLIKHHKLDVIHAKSGQLIYFDWQTFHTGTRASGNGWRWFGRLTRSSDRCNKKTNEIRRQAQVYLEFPMEGW